MLISGLQKLSLMDYPNKIASVVFTGGCNFNCFYCHNRELIKQSAIPASMIITDQELFDFLQSRVNKIEAVVVTGGEPTIHGDLPELIKRIKALGFLVKLDSNGTNPKMLKRLIEEKLIDYVAMDIKAPLNWEDYKKVIQVENEKIFDNVLESVQILREGNIDYEFRTSLVDGLFTKEDIVKMVNQIKNDKTYYLQNFVNPGKELLDEEFKIMYNNLKPVNRKEFKEFENLANILGQKTQARDY